MSFAERAFYELNSQTPLLIGWHIEQIAAKLDACRRGEIKRLIINLPPRNLKSHLASISLPAWYLGHYPARNVICACYGQELSEKFARDCRRIMLTAWYERLFATRLSDRLAVNDFATNDNGTRLATSISGPTTGRGADLIIIDDPLKPDEALSDARRDAVNQWFDNTLYSRLNDKESGCIIIVMQRLHQDDLVGHVLEYGDWEVVSFPAIAEEDETHVIETPFGRRTYERRQGEPLHPERESLATLEAIRQRSLPYTFAGQYQQRPIPIGGNMVKLEWLRYFELSELPKNHWYIVQSWDTANKAAELNDYSACTTWAVITDHFYLLDVFRARLNYPDLKRKIVEHAGSHNARTILIEDKASGTQLIQDLCHEIYGVQPYEPPTGMDKLMRLHAQTAHFANGFVHLPVNAPWLQDYVTELTGFPGTKYDDQVDSTSQALDYMSGPARSLAIWEKLGQG